MTDAPPTSPTQDPPAAAAAAAAAALSKALRIGGLVLTMRIPTESEVLAFQDKREAARDPANTRGDFLDDGDEELCACVTSPCRDQVDALLEDHPLAVRHLAEAFRELAGGGQVLSQDDSLITEELAAAYPRAQTRPGAPTHSLVGLRFGDAALVVRRFSRLEVKFLQRETVGAGRRQPSAAQLAEAAKQHVVRPADAAALWARYPLLAYSLGLLLVELAGAKREDGAGK